MNIYEKVKRFYVDYKGAKTVIGKSLLGRELYAVKVGEGRPIGLAQYAMHGREFITAALALSQVRRGLFRGSCWFIPLMNPDGALLSQMGITSVRETENRERLLAFNGNRNDFSLWKANARGVDLNVNFLARWGEGVKNLRVPGPENFIGDKPFSELETQAIRDFTVKFRPDYTVSYHTKGEEIYWHFHQPLHHYNRDKQLAEVVSRSTGYPLAVAKGSAGGYKDWCISHFGIPAFTIEAGADFLHHPIGEDGLEDIVKKNKNVLFDLSKAYGSNDL